MDRGQSLATCGLMVILWRKLYLEWILVAGTSCQSKKTAIPSKERRFWRYLTIRWSVFYFCASAETQAELCLIK